MPHTHLNSLDMLSILGLFSHSKLQTNPEATASSWRLARDYNRGLKLVHYNYTALFIYFTFYKSVLPHIVSFQLPSSLACIPCMSLLARHCLALTQESGLGPDPVSKCCNIGYLHYYMCTDVGCYLLGVAA